MRRPAPRARPAAFAKAWRALELGIEEVALKIENRRSLDSLGVYVGGAQLRASPQKSAHGALGVGGDVDEAAAGGRAADERLSDKIDPDSADVVGEDAAERIIGHLADEDGFAAEVGEPRRGIGRRAARGFHRLAHLGVKVVGARLIDEAHGPLRQSLGGEEGVVGGRLDVDQSVADGGEVVGGGHPFSGRGRRWRPIGKRQR